MSEVLFTTLPPIVLFLICIGCCTEIRRRKIRQRLPPTTIVVSEPGPIPVSYAPPMGELVTAVPIAVQPMYPTAPLPMQPMYPTQFPYSQPQPSAPPMGGQGYYAPNM